MNYFDGDYFDGAYFDTEEAGGSSLVTKRRNYHPRQPEPEPQPIDEDWIVLIL